MSFICQTNYESIDFNVSDEMIFFYPTQFSLEGKYNVKFCKSIQYHQNLDQDAVQNTNLSFRTTHFV